VSEKQLKGLLEMKKVEVEVGLCRPDSESKCDGVGVGVDVDVSLGVEEEEDVADEDELVFRLQ